MDNPKSPQPPALEIEPAGEANTALSTALPINDAVEPPQTEPIQAPAEPVPAPETPQNEPLSEPMVETPTAQMGRNEPLTESASTPETPSAEVSVEVPEIETPTPSEPETITSVTSEETPLKTEESPRTPSVTQQGTAQPEPALTPAPSSSAPESMPARAPVIATPPQNIVGLILTKARLIIQLRKQKKLNKVMGLFATKNKITNDEVEKLLHVSDATATRYLSELEKQGKITQTGKTGHAVTYTKR